MKKNGISLIVLVITIIIIIILASAILLALNGSNIMDNARLAVLLNNKNTLEDSIMLCYTGEDEINRRYNY